MIFVWFLMMMTALRIVDNKAVLYFEAPSTSDALTWFRGTYPEVNILLNDVTHAVIS